MHRLLVVWSLAALLGLGSGTAPVFAQQAPTPSLPLTGSEIITCFQSGSPKSCTSGEIGHTAIAGGSNGQIQINSSGAFGGITTGTGVVTALGGAVNSSSGLVTSSGATIVGSAQTIPLGIWGTSLYPNYTAPVTTTANSTAGSSTITVGNASGLAVYQVAYASFLPTGCSTAFAAYSSAYITAISGTNITLSCPASTTQSGGSVQFGQQKYDSTASLIENYEAAEFANFGAASAGNGCGWVSQIAAGCDYRPTYTMRVFSVPGGGGGGLFAARTSDATGGASAFPLTCLLLVDTFTSERANECLYIQGNYSSATAGYQPGILSETSLNSLWPTKIIDPYQANVINATTIHRLDCGTGQYSGAQPNSCSTAFDIVFNGAVIENGITIYDGALDTSSGRVAPAMAMPQNVGLEWFSGANTPSFTLWSGISSSFPVVYFDLVANDSIQFRSSGTAFLNINSGTVYPTQPVSLGTAALPFTGVYSKASYLLPTSFSSGPGSVTCNSTNEGLHYHITDGSTAVFNATVSGGGPNHVDVMCNGSNWVVQ